MTFGPLEFAAYIRRKQSGAAEPATIGAARAAAPLPRGERNRLTIVSGPHAPVARAGASLPTGVGVFETIAAAEDSSPGTPPVHVRVSSVVRPVVLVLSSHRPVSWCIERAPRVTLLAVLLAGGGSCTVRGASDVPVTSIGGFYAFRRGSQEFRHLEDEVLRATGCTIRNFHSARLSGGSEVGGD